MGNGGGIAFSNLTMLDLSTATQTTADSTAASTFPAICTNGTGSPTFTYTSANTSGTDFRFIGGTDAAVFITYTLYPSADGTGTAIVGGNAVAHPDFTADGTTKTLNLSAKILAAAKAAKKVQTYSDTITITAGWTP
ncbi:hypothetical protein D8I24_2789 (plasmid) [Cupriavidus necator H850]|nr:hypothetical protein D8I24_2789 [Cupriavidus necator H850]